MTFMSSFYFFYIVAIVDYAQKTMKSHAITDTHGAQSSFKTCAHADTSGKINTHDHRNTRDISGKSDVHKQRIDKYDKTLPDQINHSGI